MLCKVAGNSSLMYLTAINASGRQIRWKIAVKVLRFRQATEDNNLGKIVKFGANAEKKVFSRLPEL